MHVLVGNPFKLRFRKRYRAIGSEVWFRAILKVDVHLGPRPKETPKLSDPIGREQFLTQGVYTRAWVQGMKKWIGFNAASLSCQIVAVPYWRKYSSQVGKPILSPKLRSIKGVFWTASYLDPYPNVKPPLVYATRICINILCILSHAVLELMSFMSLVFLNNVLHAYGEDAPKLLWDKDHDYTRKRIELYYLVRLLLELSSNSWLILWESSV